MLHVEMDPDGNSTAFVLFMDLTGGGPDSIGGIVGGVGGGGGVVGVLAVAIAFLVVGDTVLAIEFLLLFGPIVVVVV